MQDELLLYYERELTYLRRMGAQFAARYPKVASRLQLEASKCEDPHVERLLEGFAFLSARVHRRLDDDLPEVSEALLDVLHPQLVRPIPSLSLVELELDPELGKISGGFSVPRNSEVRSRAAHGMPCRFLTCYDTVLWPCTVSQAEWTSADRAGGTRIGEAAGAMRLELRAFDGMRLGSLLPPNTSNGAAPGAPPGLDTLRLHFAGDANVTDTVYELLHNNLLRVVVRDPDQPTRAPVVLPAASVRPVGFEPDENMLPYPRRAVAAYTLLQELFAFPQKFLFGDIDGIGRALRTLNAGARAELYFVIAPFERAERRQVLELGLAARVFRLGCTPVINLFDQTAEPILLTQRSPEYPVIPDVRRRLEIEAWSVEKVSAMTPGESEPETIEPLYGFRFGRSDTTGVFWNVTRRPSGWRTDTGTELFLSFADLSGRVRAPDSSVATIQLRCHNGDLPSRLPFGADERGDFELVRGGPIRRIICLVKPTPVVQPPLGKPLLWRLVSTLSLNHLSLVDEGRDALRELLRLHNAGDALAGDRQIQGISGLRSGPAYARVSGEHGVAFARGRRVEIDIDEEQFPGGGLFLFASVLERFFALYATVNSFTQLAVRSRQRKQIVREWAPRAGCRTLI